MDKKGEKKDPKAAAGKAPAGKDAKPAAKEPQKPAAKEEKKEETAEERRLREEREELKAQKNYTKKNTTNICMKPQPEAILWMIWEKNRFSRNMHIEDMT